MRCDTWKRAVRLLSSLLWLLAADAASAQDAVAPGSLAAEPTYEHVGLRWQLSGDDNLNAGCTIRYRRAGTTEWRPGLALPRRVRSSLSFS